MSLLSVKIKLFLVCLLSYNTLNAQLKAFGGRQNDNNCKVVYLVNPTDSIYYIAGLNQNALNDCQTFNGKIQTHSNRYRINVSSNEDNYLLLLPKDSIAFMILIPSENQHLEKELSLLLRNSHEVIATNNDKKRNRQINRLVGRRINIQIIN